MKKRFFNSTRIQNSLIIGKKNKFFSSLSSKKSPNTFLSSINRFKNLQSPKTSKKKKNKKSIKSTIKQSIRSDRSNRSEFYISIVENKSRQIGFCAFSIFTGKIIIGTITDNILYENSISTLLKIFPIEIFIPDSQKNSFFIVTLKKNFKDTKFNFLNSCYYNENKGFSLYMKTRFYKKSFDLDNNYLAFASLNALNSIFNSNEIQELKFELLELEIYEFNKFLIIDNNTLKDLEILVNSQNGKSKNCFFNLFRCRTLSGIRYLRGLLTQPFKDLSSISENIKFLNFISDNFSVFEILDRELSKFKNFDNITIKFLDQPNLESESSLLRLYSTIVDIKLFSDRYVFLYDLLIKKSETVINLFDFVKFRNKDHLKIIQEIIIFLEANFDFSVIKEKNNIKDNFVFFLKKDVSVFVDLSRYSYTKLFENLLELFEGYKNLIENSNLSNFKMHNTKKRKYHLRIKIKEPFKKFKEDLSSILKEELISGERKKKYFYFTTSNFSTLNNRIDKCNSEILLKTMDKVWLIYKKIQKNLPFLFEINFQISKLDSNLAIFELCQKNNYKCIPLFLENEKFKIFKIKNSLSPILPKKISTQNIIKQDYLSFDTSNTNILLGDINSGKTSYLKQIAYLTILAQIGSYLPCKNAILTPFSRLVGKFNNITNNELQITSDFGQDLLFFNKVDRWLKDDKGVSLILIDGFGNGTNSEELGCILKPVFFEFLKSVNHFTFFASCKFEVFFAILPIDGLRVRFIKEFFVCDKFEKGFVKNEFFFGNDCFRKLFEENICKESVLEFENSGNKKAKVMEDCVEKFCEYLNDQEVDLNEIKNQLQKIFSYRL